MFFRLVLVLPLSLRVRFLTTRNNRVPPIDYAAPTQTPPLTRRVSYTFFFRAAAPVPPARDSAVQVSVAAGVLAAAAAVSGISRDPGAPGTAVVVVRVAVVVPAFADGDAANSSHHAAKAWGGNFKRQDYTLPHKTKNKTVDRTAKQRAQKPSRAPGERRQIV